MTTRRGIIAILIFSTAAIALLFWLIYGVEMESASGLWDFLPAANALFNAMSAMAVCVGLWHIRNHRKRAHALSMGAALAASTMFLIGYIIHHSLHGDTRFLTEGWLRPVYFFILASHILLSVIVLPMVLITVFLAIRRSWSSHRIVARYTYPIWLYVSVTGVLVFFFLRYLNTPLS